MSKFEFNPDLRGGGKGWACIGAFVVSYDLLAGETLSNAYSRAMNSENRAIRFGTAALSAVTALHLLDRLGDLDPIDNLTEQIKERFGDE